MITFDAYNIFCIIEVFRIEVLEVAAKVRKNVII